MRVIFIVVGIILAIAGSNALPKKPYYNISDAPMIFEKYIRDYNKQYKDMADKLEHYMAFVQSLEKINQLNAQDDLAVFGINKFTDYTPSQWKKMNGYLPGPLSARG